MTFLQLCQRCAVECGASGTIATVSGQQGSLARVVNWVGDAWNDIQIAHDDWDWMRASNILGSGVSFVPASGQYTTPLGTGAGTIGVATDSFGKWDRDTFRCYTTTVGTSNETFLDCISFDNWRNAYMLGAMREVRTRPVAVAVGPDQSINLGPPPNGDYTITGDYWMAPSVMTSDADVPTGLPTRFHMLIVYKAMLKYAGYEAAAEVFQRASMEWTAMYSRLESLRMPRINMAGALA